jgi:prepilin-type N-terminal cleavage/methylation domain-containing protein
MSWLPARRERHTRGISTRAGDERGFTIVEVLVSIVVLSVGLLGVFGTLDGTNDSVAAAGRATVMTQLGQAALQAAEALPWADLSDSSDPVQTSTTDTTNPTYYLSGCTASSCTKYQWDPTNSSTVETLDVSTTNGKVTPLTTAVVAAPTGTCTTTSTSACQMTVTDSTDVICSQSGVTCPSSLSYSYKRIIVAVKNAGSGAPKNPVYLSTIVDDPTGGAADPLYGATSSTSSTYCVDGTTDVACTH